MKKIFNLALASLLLLAGGVATAATEMDQVDNKLRASLQVLLPNLQPDTIAETPINGLYEVTFGTRLVYVSADGRYLMKGRMIDLETRTPITEQREQTLKQAALDSLDESKMIIYGNDDARHTVTVFTDVDCGYCRKLHSEMDKYVDAGIRIRYLSYPRAGLNSSSARVAESIWCADDRHAAMDSAKGGQSIDTKTCASSPIAEHYQLGQSFGISGTPALILDDGEVVPGYIPAARLADALDKRAAELAAQAATAGTSAAN